MKHHPLIIILLSLLALSGCTDQLVHTALDDDKPVLLGHAYTRGFAESAATEQSSPLPAGSQILLNASGSFQTDNQVLTYTGDRWEAETELDWTDYAGTARMVALYPAHPDLTYTADNLYTGQSLEDILYAEGEFAAGKSINLQFKHLFSLLTLQLDKALQQDFQEIKVTCPTVASIDPKTAQVTLSQEALHTTSFTQLSSSGKCSFIIPSAEGMNVSISIQANGKTYSTELLSKSFASGKEYTYNLKTSEKTPGIVSAEDWIAFSQLINHKSTTEYNGKKLTDFGETINGVTTYYLLNDIDFAGVNCQDLEPIGYAKTDYYFQDIFDGQGYVLSNMPIESYGGTMGIFGDISNTAVVKNLHVKSCNITLKKSSSGSTKSGVGILIGTNNGHIYNCSVNNCSILFEKDEVTNIGGLAGTSSGIIINCSVQNINIIKDNTEKNSHIGGLIGSGSGTILNSFSANNYLKVKGSSNYVGGIYGKATTNLTTAINNCYIYIETGNLVPKNQSGNFIGNANNATIGNCYYNQNGYANIQTGKNNSVKAYPYQSDFTYNGTPIYQLLNQWIDETAPALYPEYTFTRWKDGGSEGLPATFETQ